MKTPFIYFIYLMPLLFVACIEFVSLNVAEVNISLQSPPDSLFTNREIIDFRWEAHELVEAYHFQLIEVENAQAYVLLDTLLERNSLRLYLAEGCYAWQIQAQNANSVSPFQSHDLFIDNSPPILPQATSPIPGDTIFQAWMPMELRWQSGDRVGETSMNVRDSVYLYKWINDWPVLLKSFERGRQTDKVIYLTEAMGSSSELKLGEYRWEVKSFDQVGNSSCSRLFNFFLQ